jgi:predicted transcriptional regulator
MADLTITAGNVIPVTGYQFEDKLAGEAITRGQTIYEKASDGKWYKSQADGTAAEAEGKAIALADAGANQPLRGIIAGNLGLGAIMTVGIVYVVSTTAGGIAPYSDLGSTNRVCLVGVATTTSNLALKIFASGAVKP